MLPCSLSQCIIFRVTRTHRESVRQMSGESDKGEIKHVDDNIQTKEYMG